MVRVHWGYRRLTALLRREGWPVNAKRIERLYREEELTVRRSPPDRVVRIKDGPARAVVVPRPALEPPANVFDVVEDLDIQTLVSQPSIGTLDEGILHGTPWLDEVQPNLVRAASSFHDRLTNSVPATSSAATLTPLTGRSTKSARHARVDRSTIVKIPKR